MKIDRLLTTALFIFLMIAPASAIKPVHANPINIGARLVMDDDSAKIASSLLYYGYTIQSSDNGKNVYKHPDDTTITVSFPSNNSSDKQQATDNASSISGDGRRATGNEKSSQAAFPSILVKSKVSQKEIQNILKDLNFQKVGNHYETLSTKHSTHITSCTPTKSGLLFQRTKK